MHAEIKTVKPNANFQLGVIGGNNRSPLPLTFVLAMATVKILHKKWKTATMKIGSAAVIIAIIIPIAV